MKEAFITDLNGSFGEPTLVADSANGVYPQYTTPPRAYDEQGNQISDPPQPVLSGYIIAVPMPHGLYEPITFDLEEYKATDKSIKGFNPSVFWSGGQAPEPVSEMPRELELLGEQLVQQELITLDLKQQYDALGGQIVGMELRLLELEAKSDV